MNTPPLIKLLLISFLLSFVSLTTASTTSPFVGGWELFEIDHPEGENDNGGVVLVNVEVDSFVMIISQPDKENDKDLKFNWKIGNMMLSSTILLGEGNNHQDDDVTIAPIVSTLLPHGESFEKVVSFASNVLEKVTSVAVTNDESNPTLEIKGTGGGLKFLLYLPVEAEPLA